jgi:hypothetical protein
MAETNVSEERKALMMDAIYELDKLARVVPNFVALDDSQNYFAVRGLCGRMLRLTSVLMSGLDINDLSDKALKDILDLAAPGQG